MENMEHDCREHLDSNCYCTICGKERHIRVDNSNNSGTGMVVEWCVRCKRYERYYDDTGTVIESTFNVSTPYNGPYCGGLELDNLYITNHRCDDFYDKQGVCTICQSVKGV